SALIPSCDTGPLSDTAPSNVDTCSRNLSISARALLMSVTASMAPALSWMDLLRSGTLFWKSSSCLENCSTGEGVLPSWEYANAEDNANTPAISKTTTVRRSGPALKGDDAIIMCLPDKNFPFAKIDFEQKY